MSAVRDFLDEFETVMPAAGWKLSRLPAEGLPPLGPLVVETLAIRSLVEPVGLRVVLYLLRDWFHNLDEVDALVDATDDAGAMQLAFQWWSARGLPDLVARLDLLRRAQAQVLRGRWATGDPVALVAKLNEAVSDRKLRLLACALASRLPEVRDDPASLEAVAADERYADGLCPRREVRRLRKASALAGWLTSYEAFPQVQAVVERARARLEPADYAALAAVVRDVIGDVERPPVVRGAWLKQGAEALAIAETIYQEGRFEELPVLADALEDAGFRGEPVLLHLRGPGPHARGCWAVDGLLDRR